MFKVSNVMKPLTDLVISDLGKNGYCIAAKVVDHDLEEIFTREELDRSEHLRLAEDNGWITVHKSKITPPTKGHTFIPRTISIPVSPVKPPQVITTDVINPIEPAKVEEPTEDQALAEALFNKNVASFEKTKSDEAASLEKTKADEVDLTKLTWSELKSLAKSKGINVLRKTKAQLLEEMKGK